MADSIQNSSATKRIARNTLMLYIRMIFTMGVTIYTSRVVLQQLGVNDYGIYNVVGAVVTMFGFLSGIMTSSITRFITFALGKKDLTNLSKIFSTSIIIQLLLGMAVVILLESVGVWFLNARMNIAPERIGAANWVLQFSMATFVVTMISVPYNALIIAYEKMSAYAYISILEAALKLGVALLLFWSPFDSLIYYSGLLFLAAIIVRFAYARYCHRHFEVCRFHWTFDKPLVKKMISFSGWSLIGSGSNMLKEYGVSILLNLFFGTVINAARGLAAVVNTAVYNFSSNFMTAVNPQIVKSYASGDHDYMHSLVLQSARFSFFMLLLLSLPLMVETEAVLHMWLDHYPPYTVIFVRLVLILSLSESLSLPLQFANQATGRIRNYQLIVGGLQLMNFPLSWVVLKLGMAPESTYVVAIVLSQLALFARVAILRNSIRLSARKFLRHVYLNIVYTSIAACAIPLTLYFILPKYNIWINFSLMFICVLSVALFVFFIGCKESERDFVISKIKAKFHL